MMHTLPEAGNDIEQCIVSMHGANCETAGMQEVDLAVSVAGGVV